MSTVVLDSWAVLRFLEDSPPAAAAVEELLAHSRPLMSWINLGEVHYVLRRAAGEDAAIETVRDLRARIDVRLPDESQILTAAQIKADNPMSYVDAFVVALALDSDAEVWTGDPEILIANAPWRWRDLRQ
jgi:predicted nucleic acid-binding protein